MPEPLVAELQLRRELGVTGAEFTQLLLQLVVGFVQHLVVLRFLLLVQSEGVVQLEPQTGSRTETSLARSLFCYPTRPTWLSERTCFKAALAWELCADSVAAALWGVARVAGTTGLTFVCEGKSGPASRKLNVTRLEAEHHTC